MINSTSIKLAFIFFTFIGNIINAQTPISGIINEYYEVNGVNSTTNVVSLNTTPNLTEGDRVLLIQMQGAIIDESNSSSFGSITNLSNAGNYEFHTVCSIENNDIYFENSIINSYDSNQSVQLIFVPTYSSAILTDTLTCQIWNGTTGGILALEIDSTLNLSSFDIDVSDKGFLGAIGSVSDDDCSWLLNIVFSYYQDYDAEPWARGRKGQGITKIIDGKECGIGPQANGGGGGNNHNGGAGGGSNYGIGGRGGERLPASTFSCNAPEGLPSIALNTGYDFNKLFFGGGGGSGHGNNVGIIGETGGNGGGIVIIQASEIISNGQQIKAKGQSNNDNSTDGGAGGGAGGTVVLDIETYTGTLTVDVSGGNGASVINGGLSNCNGPGGGGGGGAVLFSNNVIPSQMTTILTGGNSGTTVATDQTNCTIGANNSAENGSLGGIITNYLMSESTENSISCLPDCILPETPVVAFSEIDFCLGEEVTVSIIEGELNGAEAWSWFATGCSDAFIINGNQLTITPDSTTTVFVSGTGGCLTTEETICTSVDLIAHETYQSTGTANICEGEEIIFGGETISEEGVYELNLLSEYGCDSIIVLNLFITEINSEIILNENVFTAQQENAIYAWIDCSNNEVIEEETGVSFTPQETGEYGAIITVGSCLELSECIDFIYDVSVIERDGISELVIYPNPASDYIVIDLSGNIETTTLVLYNILGEVVLEMELDAGVENKVEVGLLDSGGYFGVVTSEISIQKFKIVKE